MDSPCVQKGWLQPRYVNSSNSDMKSVMQRNQGGRFTKSFKNKGKNWICGNVLETLTLIQIVPEPEPNLNQSAGITRLRLSHTGNNAARETWYSHTEGKKRERLSADLVTAIFSRHFQTPIRTTLIQPPQRASTTPWISTACWGRPSAAWEGNQFSGTCRLSQRGTSDTSLLFLAPLTTRLPEVLHSVVEYKRISLYRPLSLEMNISQMKFTWT